MKYIYVGPMPPPYGGVTIKNHMLYDYISKNMPIEYIDYGFNLRKIIKNAVKLFLALVSRDTTLVLGIGSNKSLWLFNLVYYCLNKDSMQKSIVIVMGGSAANYFCSKKWRINLLKTYKSIFVETSGMKEVFIKSGMKNVCIFPNCRERPKHTYLNTNTNPSLKCLYFSLISKEKGADIVLSAANALENKDSIFFDFYGEIDSKFKEEFFCAISQKTNVNYKGVFKGDISCVYDVINEYDVLILPTRWKNEGVPGVLVEAKIAGVPSIVSDLNFNKEIIEDGKSGIVLKDNNSDELIAAIRRLCYDKNLLISMKKNALLSSNYYFIENHIENIIDMIRGE